MIPLTLFFLLSATVTQTTDPVALSMSGPLVTAFYSVVPGQDVTGSYLNIQNAGTVNEDIQLEALTLSGELGAVQVETPQSSFRLTPRASESVYPSFSISESARPGNVTVGIIARATGETGEGNIASASIMAVIEFRISGTSHTLTLRIVDQQNIPWNRLQVFLSSGSIRYANQTLYNGSLAWSLAPQEYRIQISRNQEVLKELDVLLEGDRILELMIFRKVVSSVPTIHLLELGIGFVLGAIFTSATSIINRRRSKNSDVVKDRSTNPIPLHRNS